MTKKQMENIRDYVREQGGGLIMIGGEESFGLGGYYRTPIEEALPVTMEVKQKLEIPSLAVVLSIDRSGSMAMTTDEKVTKLDIAKEASHLVVDLLDERNEVGVMSWDTEFIWDSALRPARDKQAIHHAISTIKAGGGTDGYPALKESYQVLFDRPALLKHVIFLSDGQMTRGDFSGLLRRMAKDKITVSTVAIGKDADVPSSWSTSRSGDAGASTTPRTTRRSRASSPSRRSWPPRRRSSSSRSSRRWPRPATRPSRTSTGRRRRRSAATSRPRSRARPTWC